jgi:hypothetical protein
MYIKKIELMNIRNIKKLTWELPDVSDEDLAGWHVLIGDNGSGKTSILQSIVLGLLGANGVSAVRHGILRYKELKGEAALRIFADITYDEDADNTHSDIFTGIVFTKTDENGFSGGEFMPRFPPNERYLNGWFSISFGAHRRFSYSHDMNFMQDLSLKGLSEKIYKYNTHRVNVHRAIFNENVILNESLDWLVKEGYHKVEHNSRNILLNSIMKFINQEDFLPHTIKINGFAPLEIGFLDHNNSIVSFRELASGYRAILGMALEIIYQMSIFYPDKPLFNPDGTQVIAPGVVIIDEVDAHLHPSWQREIGTRFTKHFPNIQFIVTTHSPLVCQASVKGSIFRLPTPGTSEKGGMIERGSENWKRLVYGDILEAYSTDLFGENIERSDVAQEIIDEISALSILEYERPLNESERIKMEQLMEQLPNTHSKYLEVARERNKKL